MKRNVYAKPWRDLMSKNLCILSLFISGCATYLPLEPVTALLQCTQAVRPRDSIVDGQEVGLWDPDQKLVLMLYVKRNHQESICTGTLISNRVILTAAHCVSDVNPQDITPYFVMTSGCPINQVRRKPAVVQMMVVHRDFDGSPKSLADMALLYLDEDAPTEQVRLPVIKSHQKITNDQILLVGFGVTDEQKKDSQVLRRVYKSLNRDVTPKNKVLILDQSKKNGGFCRGDSGAPLIGEIYGEPYILGVNSASIGIEPKRECHLLSVVMDANYFGSWIEKNKNTVESTNWFSRWISGNKILSD